MIARILSIALVTCAGSSLEAAEVWQTTTQTDPTTGAERSSASVTNEDGFRFTVTSGGGRSARCSLALPEAGAEPFDLTKLPSFSVDGAGAIQIARWQAEKKEEDLFDDGGDFMEAVRREVRAEPLIGIDSSRVRFSCWTAMRDQASPTSGALRQIMSGHQLVIRYDAADGGSEEVVFSLDGAGEEISAALGISLEPTETDFLQEELLRFRIEYRHNTCYLLAGRKNRKRCLEAVTACAQKSHDSIFSMTGCIEVE